MLKVSVTFFHGHGEEYSSECGVYGLRRDSFDESMEAMEVKKVEDASRYGVERGAQGNAKGCG